MYLRIKWLAVFVVGIMLLFSGISVDAQANRAADDLEGKAEYAYVLTMEKVSKIGEVRSAIGERVENHKNTSEKQDRDKSLAEGTLVDHTRFLNLNYPEIAAIIREHGMSTQEYLLANRALTHAMLLFDARKQGETKDYARNVNPANLVFIERQQEEVRKSIHIKIKM